MRKIYKITPKNDPDYKKVEEWAEKWLDIFQLNNKRVKYEFVLRDPEVNEKYYGVNKFDLVNFKTRGPDHWSRITLHRPVWESTLMHELAHSRLYITTGLLTGGIFNYSKSTLHEDLNYQIVTLYWFLQEYFIEYYTLEVASEMKNKDQDFREFLGETYSPQGCSDIINNVINDKTDTFEGLSPVLEQFLLKKGHVCLTELFRYKSVLEHETIYGKDCKYHILKGIKASLLSLLPKLRKDRVFHRQEFASTFCKFANFLGSTQLNRDAEPFKYIDGVITATPDLNECLSDLNAVVVRYNEILDRTDLAAMFARAIEELPKDRDPTDFVLYEICGNEGINLTTRSVLAELLLYRILGFYLEEVIEPEESNI